MSGYVRDQCALYRVTSPARLAEILSSAGRVVTVAELNALAAAEDNFSIREEPKPGGGSRRIEEPKPRLQALHGRIHRLLSGMQLPDYVHSVRKGRSYITNARQHLNGSPMVKLDVQKFYPNVRAGAVFAFFHERMQCARDVAGLLASLLTIDRHLATGSKASPILSYLVHQTMFDEIAAQAKRRGLVVTLYVDDIVLSGPNANSGVIAVIRRIISSHGLRSHKIKQFSGRRPKIVTGIMVTVTGLRLPNRRHELIRDGYASLRAAKSPQAKLRVLDVLCSRVHEAAQFDLTFRSRAIGLETLRRQLRLMVGHA